MSEQTKLLERCLNTFQRQMLALDGMGWGHALACNYQDPRCTFCNCGLAQARVLIPELQAALSASGAGVDAWQPISTAPKKDGVLVLLHPSRCWAEDVNADCEVGYWDEIAQDWVAVGAPADDYTGPTHWMPLPANPLAGVDVPPPPCSETT
jgi:hypothetical protein